MTLITSKINSLAWLKSAIYISVVGGVILSSTPVLSAAFVFPPREDEDNISFIVKEGTFLTGNSRLVPDPKTSRWDTRIDITRTNGGLFGGDTLLVEVFLQHIVAPHRGDNGFGSPLALRLFVDTAKPYLNILSDSDSKVHPGVNHRDRATGSLTPTINRNSINSDINDWTLEVRASHVPEPTTIFGTALALGWGGWLKRKNLIK